MKFSKGDKVRIIRQAYGHGFSIGEVVSIEREYSPNNHYFAVNKEGQGWYVNDEELDNAVNPFRKKDEVERLFIDLVASIGMDIPENFEDIVQFIYEDILDTADDENWNNSDVVIGFRRWIESQ